MPGGERLRLGLIAGVLGTGGAEKQLVYMAQAMAERGADVRVFSLTHGERHEAELVAAGIPPHWVGQRDHPVARVSALIRAMRDWRPHVIQAGHFYVNLHATIAAMTLGALGIGAIRNDAFHDVKANGLFGRPLLRAPRALIANSHAARRNAASLGVDASRIAVVPNVIDVEAHDRESGGHEIRRFAAGTLRTVAVARLVEQKRLDIYIEALALARSQFPGITGTIVGTGPELERLRHQGERLGLRDGLQFLGNRLDVPVLLGSADALALTSRSEGFPNVVLEAMASALPVVTTPAGDAGRIVRDGISGLVAEHDNPESVAGKLITLAADPLLRQRMSEAARTLVIAEYSRPRLVAHLSAAYGRLARHGPQRARAALEGGLASN